MKDVLEDILNHVSEKVSTFTHSNIKNAVEDHITSKYNCLITEDFYISLLMNLLDKDVPESMKKELIKNPFEVSETILSTYLEKYKSTCLGSDTYEDLSSECLVSCNKVGSSQKYDYQNTKLSQGYGYYQTMRIYNERSL